MVFHYLVLILFMNLTCPCMAFEEQNVNCIPRSDRDKAYSPSYNVNPENPGSVVPAFFELVTNLSNEARKTVSHKLGIRYGAKGGQLLDEYGTDLPADSDILVFLHGGYWVAGSRDKSANMAPVYYKNGIRMFIAGYDLTPKVTLQEIVDEIKDLIRYTLKYATDNNVKKVWLMGHSAGAHLCIAAYDSLVANNCRLSGMLLISGIYDLHPLVGTSIGNSAGINNETADSLSPMTRNGCNLPVNGLKFMVIVGGKEPPAFHCQKETFSKVLRKEGAYVEEHIEPGVDHFTIISNMTDPEFNLNTQILNFISAN